MKKILVVCILLTSVFNVFAQSDASDSKSILIKIAPFKIIGFENVLSVSAERRFNYKFSSQLQLDYIFYSLIGTTSSVQNKHDNGFRIIPEARYYVSNAEKMSPFYIGGQLMYKYLRTSQEEYRSFTDAAGQSYLQLLTNIKQRHVFAPTFLTGWLFYLNEERRFSIDLNAGLGIRHRFVNSTLDPLQNGVFTIDTDKQIVVPNAVCNLKLCYSIFR